MPGLASSSSVNQMDSQAGEDDGDDFGLGEDIENIKDVDLNVLNAWNEEFDQTDKARDAIDYDDLDSDEELPDEEPPTPHHGQFSIGATPDSQNVVNDSFGTTAATSDAGTQDRQGANDDDDGDLFGDDDDDDDDAEEAGDDDLFGESDEEPVAVQSTYAGKTLPGQLRASIAQDQDVGRRSPLLFPGMGLKQPRLALPGQGGAFSRSQYGAKGLPTGFRAPQSSSSPPEQRPPTLSPIEAQEQRQAQTAKLLQDMLEMEDERYQEWARIMKGDTQAPPADVDHLVAQAFPSFKEGCIPEWYRLMPPRQENWQKFTLPKPMKPLGVPDVVLEIMPDDEALFLSSSTAVCHKRSFDAFKSDYWDEPIQTKQLKVEKKTLDHEYRDTIEKLYKNPVAGLSSIDIQLACVDWDATIDPPSPPQSPTTPTHPLRSPSPDVSPSSILHRQSFLHEYLLDELDDPEAATAKLAERVILDFNDPNLLLQRLSLEEAQACTGETKRLNPLDRYNISNDADYEKLRENQQRTIRASNAKVVTAHALPALRLTANHYTTYLERSELRRYLRTPLHFSRKLIPEYFSRRIEKKRKVERKKPINESFKSARDLSLGDYGVVSLLEYSEERPMVMTKLGMNTKLVNYYRRKTDDLTYPIAKIGETRVLMPEDASPLTMFGIVNPGETVPAIDTGLFKAPVFQHNPQETDFLMVRTTTNDREDYILKKFDFQFVVGQQFPSVEIPGPNSRRVTTTQKNRLKMVAYRIMRQDKDAKKEKNYKYKGDKGKEKKRTGPLVPGVTVAELSKHFPDQSDIQLKQKLKEFLVFDRVSSSWQMRDGQPVPTEEQTRAMISPEDACLVEAMEVGQQAFEDSGYGKADQELDVDQDQEDEEGNVEQLTAPWALSRNFQQACQGKAMLELHGEADPTGRGQALSFIKTSMKGGFKAVGQSVNDRLDEKSRKELGGHSYNVAQQERDYKEAIKRVWDAQKNSLSARDPNPEADEDIDILHRTGPGPDGSPLADDNMASALTPAADRNQFMPNADEDDESLYDGSQAPAGFDRALKVRRLVDGEWEEEVIRDRKVIWGYMKKHLKRAVENDEAEKLKMTGDPTFDAQVRKIMAAEQDRLTKNEERRKEREKAKAKSRARLGAGLAALSTFDPGDDESPAPGSVLDAHHLPGRPGKQIKKTNRTCTACGIPGHIATNRSLCPAKNPAMLRLPRHRQLALALAESGRLPEGYVPMPMGEGLGLDGAADGVADEELDGETIVEDEREGEGGAAGMQEVVFAGEVGALSVGDAVGPVDAVQGVPLAEPMLLDSVLVAQGSVE